MKRKPIVMSLLLTVMVALLFVGFAGRAVCQESKWTGNVNLLIGAKALDEDDWEPAHEHAEFAIGIDFGKTNWPIAVAIDLIGSAGEGTLGSFDVEASTSEFDLGVRKIWKPAQKVRPFLGGGIAFITGTMEVKNSFASVKDDDTGTGFWINGGIYMTLNELINLGIEARVSSAEIELNGVEGNAGGGHFCFFVGFHM